MGGIDHHEVALAITDRASQASKSGEDGAILNSFGDRCRLGHRGAPARPSAATARRVVGRVRCQTADWPVVPPDKGQPSHAGLITQRSRIQIPPPLPSRSEDLLVPLRTPMGDKWGTLGVI